MSKDETWQETAERLATENTLAMMHLGEALGWDKDGSGWMLKVDLADVVYEAVKKIEAAKEFPR